MQRLPDILATGVIMLAVFSLLIPYAGGIYPIPFIELGFAERLKEYIQSGWGNEITWLYQADYNFPPLLIWLGKLISEFTGDTLYSYRMGSILIHTISLASMYVMGSKFAGDRMGFWWIVIILTSPFLFIYLCSAQIYTAGIFFTFFAIKNLAYSRFSHSGNNTGFLLKAGIFTGLAFLSSGLIPLLLILIISIIRWASDHFVFRNKIQDLSMYISISLILCLTWPCYIFYNSGIQGIYNWMHLMIQSIQLFNNYYFIPLFLIFGCFPAHILALSSHPAIRDLDSTKREFNFWMQITSVIVLASSLIIPETVIYIFLPISFFSAFSVSNYIRDKYTWPRFNGNLLILIGGIILVAFIMMSRLSSFKYEFLYLPFFMENLLAHFSMPWLMCASIALFIILIVAGYFLFQKKIYTGMILLGIPFILFNGIFIGQISEKLTESVYNPLIKLFNDNPEMKHKLFYFGSETPVEELHFISGRENKIHNIYQIETADSGCSIITITDYKYDIRKNYPYFNYVEESGPWVLYTFSGIKKGPK